MNNYDVTIIIILYIYILKMIVKYGIYFIDGPDIENCMVNK